MHVHFQVFICMCVLYGGILFLGTSCLQTQSGLRLASPDNRLMGLVGFIVDFFPRLANL